MSDIFRDYSFGGWLRSFRLQRKVGLREMSRQTGYDASNYCAMEMSRIAPPNSAEKIKKLVKPLKLEKAELQMLITAAHNWHLSRITERFEP